MLTKGAIEDLIAARLPGMRPGGKPAPRKVPELKKKVFLTDLQLRRLYAPGSRSIKVPANAILSPLALDWLDFEGITVFRE